MPLKISNLQDPPAPDTDSGGSFKITAIKPAVKNEHRVNIFIDDKYDFSLDLSQVVDFKLKVGQFLSESQLKDCRKASEFGKLYQRTLEYVLSRPHSVRETRDHLKNSLKKREVMNRYSEKQLPLYSEEDAEKVIAMLVQKGYLDDVKFTDFYLENRFVKKGISRKRLEQELVKKGITSDIIEQAFAKSVRNDADEIQKIISKKRAKYDDEKLISYLVRQGFDYQQSKAAVSEMDSQN